MVNAWRDTNHYKEFESIEDYIFSKATEFGFDKYVDHQESDGDRYFPTRTFEETTDVHKLHEEYDEETFWDELAERFGERDFFKKYTIKQIKKMSRDEYFTKLTDCVEAIKNEIYTDGIENFKIIKK